MDTAQLACDGVRLASFREVLAITVQDPEGSTGKTLWANFRLGTY